MSCAIPPLQFPVWEGKSKLKHASLRDAAPEMFTALVLYEQGYEALANWERRKGEKLLAAAHEKRKAALAKARGEAS